MPGAPERLSHGHVRAGTTILFAALGTATGKAIGSLHRRHRAAEFRKFLVTLDKEVPADLQVHLHLTPTGSSWLNPAERWFAEFTTKKLRRGVHRSVPALERDIRSWRAGWNEHPRPFAWTKLDEDRRQAPGKVAVHCRRIPDSGDEPRIPGVREVRRAPGGGAGRPGVRRGSGRRGGPRRRSGRRP